MSRSSSRCAPTNICAPLEFSSPQIKGMGMSGLACVRRARRGGRPSQRLAAAATSVTRCKSEIRGQTLRRPRM